MKRGINIKKEANHLIGKTVTVVCHDIYDDGNSVAVYDRNIVAITGLLPGEIASVIIKYHKGSIYIAELY